MTGAGSRGHTRVVFGIAMSGNDSSVLTTVSMDRQVGTRFDNMFLLIRWLVEQCFPFHVVTSACDLQQRQIILFCVMLTDDCVGSVEHVYETSDSKSWRFCLCIINVSSTSRYLVYQYAVVISLSWLSSSGFVFPQLCSKHLFGPDFLTSDKMCGTMVWSSAKFMICENYSDTLICNIYMLCIYQVTIIKLTRILDAWQ